MRPSSRARRCACCRWSSPAELLERRPDLVAAERRVAAVDRVTILESQVRDHGWALELEQVRLRVGRTDLRSVTQQQLALFASRSSLLRREAERLAQRVALSLALGGDFETGRS